MPGGVRSQGSIGFDRDKKSESFHAPDSSAAPRATAGPESIDDMRRPEGFHPAIQPQISPGILPAPIINTGPRSKSRLGRHRRRAGLKSGIKPKRAWWKRTKRVLIGTSAAMLLVVAYFVIKIYIVQKHLFRGGGNAPALAQDVDVSTLRGEGDGRVNILLLGIGGPGHDAPDLSDTIVIVSIDPVNNQVALLSIPRDLWVQIPGYGSQKINAAFSYGKQGSSSTNFVEATKDGIELAEKTLDPIIGIPIHYHAVVDFTAFKQSVDAVGGVTVNVPEQLYDPSVAWENNYDPVIAEAGVQVFNGSRALLYARSRETSSDFARNERQRLLMVALKDKILSLGTFSNPLKISQLLDSLGNNVYTDFSSSDFGRLYEIAGNIPSDSIFSLDLVTPPHNFLTTAPINGLSAVVPRAGLNNYDDIKNFIRNSLKDGFIQKENAEVVILNGTSTPGLATLKAKDLKSYGYNVTTVADAPTEDYQNTILVDVTGDKKYTKHYLEQRLNTTATTELPAGIEAGTASFVIILGADSN